MTDRDGSIFAVTYDTTIDDLVAFNMHWIATSPQTQRIQRINRYGGAVAILLLGGIITAYEQKAGRGNGYLIMGVLPAFIWLLVYPAYARHYARRHLLKLFASGKNKGMLGEHRMEVSPDSVIEETDVNRSVFSWQGIEKVEMSADYVYLWVSAATAHLVPRRAFADNAGFVRFFETCRQYADAGRH